MAEKRARTSLCPFTSYSFLRNRNAPTAWGAAADARAFEYCG